MTAVTIFSAGAATGQSALLAGVQLAIFAAPTAKGDDARIETLEGGRRR